MHCQALNFDVTSFKLRLNSPLLSWIYRGTVDNECYVHALVGGIIHQVGQVAETEDCNSILPASFQSHLPVECTQRDEANETQQRKQKRG